jgi:bifunctional UDP-N-acetylglucosamine pyrophosphorylase / glucosamine-1-phosphate N-acetyltransferase
MLSNERIDKLAKKGVQLPAPESIELGPEVDFERISGDGVILHAGCKLFGKNTLICAGALIGQEGPVTIDNCQIGPEVTLKGGYFKESVFLEKANMGSGAHVREGTILEEEASGAHTVGLKQTILFPYVTLGSLINFCDCLMAGGTSRKNHSEVGSSYIHFNFTPNQDKATASLIGDVPHGVMQNQPPIFLGGQGGLVGPCRLAFGTVIAAGSIYRKDELRPGRLLVEGGGRGGNLPFIGGMYRSIKRIVEKNIIYIANLIALRRWYEEVRRQFISNAFPEPLLEGLLDKMDMGISERLKRFKELSRKMPESARIYRATVGENASASLLAQKIQLYERWPEMEGLFLHKKCRGDGYPEKDQFLDIIQKQIQECGKDYLAVIKSLDPAKAEIGSRWLQHVVDTISCEMFDILSTFGFSSKE